VDATDCEFVDGFHPGDVASETIALSPGGSLAPYLDHAFGGEFTTAHRGRTGGGDRYRMDGEREVDFLQLGCDKKGP